MKYDDGELRYIISPRSIKVGDKLNSGDNVEIRDGNCLPIKNIPVGTNIHNIELKPGAGGQLIRSAGSSAQIVSKELPFVHVFSVKSDILIEIQRQQSEKYLIVTKILNLVRQVERGILVLGLKFVELL